MTNWHGWEVRDALTTDQRPALHIGPLHGRKNIAIYTVRTTEFVAEVNILGYFKSEEAARTALEYLDLIARVRP